MERDIHRETHTHTNIERHAVRDAQRVTHIQGERHTNTHTEIHAHMERDIQRERDTHTNTHIERYTHIRRETYRERHTHKHRETRGERRTESRKQSKASCSTRNSLPLDSRINSLQLDCKSTGGVYWARFATGAVVWS